MWNTKKMSMKPAHKMTCRHKTTDIPIKKWIIMIHRWKHITYSRNSSKLQLSSMLIDMQICFPVQNLDLLGGVETSGSLCCRVQAFCKDLALQKTLVKGFDSLCNSSSVLLACRWLLHHLLSVIEGPPVGINDLGYRPDCLTPWLPGSAVYLASRLLQTPSPSNHRTTRTTPDYCSLIDSLGLSFEMILDKPLQASVQE